jgi:hypothetical protein
MIKRIAFLFFLCFLSLDLFALFEEITVSGKVIVKDTATGLEWTKEYATNKTWQQALDYCETLNYGDYSDWRLPNIEELKTLIDDTIYGPASTFPGMSSNSFWSSSSSVSSTNYAWYVYFYYGYVYYYYKTSYNYARCVR